MKCTGDLKPGYLQAAIYITELQACQKEMKRNQPLVSVSVSSGQRLGCTARTVRDSGPVFYQHLWVTTQRLSFPRTVLTELSMVNFLSSSVIRDKALLKTAIKPSVVNLYHFPSQLTQECNCCHKSLSSSGFKNQLLRAPVFNSKQAISSQ